MVLIYVIRHGESVGNAEKRMGGLTDFKLTENGIKRAKLLAKWIFRNSTERENLSAYDGSKGNKIPFSTIYTSPLSRAVDTAKIFLEELKLSQSEEPSFIVDERIIEVKTGELDGVLFSELGIYEELIRKVPYHPELQFPGGEKIQELIDRTMEFANDLLNKHLTTQENAGANAGLDKRSEIRERIAIFSHQLPINYLLHHLLQFPVDGLNRFPVENATVSIVSYKRSFPQLLLYNCSPVECLV